MAEPKTFQGEPLVVPLLNINGTDASNLIDGWAKAHDALLHAIPEVMQCVPHMRDFQTYADPSTAYTAAVRQHMARVGMLNSIDQEICNLAHAVQEAQAKRLNR